MASRTAPYGTWRSPITAELLVHQAVGLGQVELDGEVVHWMESRPSEGGRQVVVRAEAEGTTTEVVPSGFSARSQVHEYGGRCYTVVGGVLVASSWEDQRLWRIEEGRPPVALTPEPASPRGARYADPVVTPDGRWVLCVRERHRLAGGDERGRAGEPSRAGEGSAGAGERGGADVGERGRAGEAGRADEGPDAGPERVDNDLVAVALDPADPPAEPVRLVGGRDFYSAPAVSPDGNELAWLCWDHPNMPWDETELWRAPLSDGPAGPSLGPATRVAGDRESVAQPRWSPAGVLHYVSDRSGWWNLYAGDGATSPVEAVFPIEAECNEPGWVFGTATYGFTGDGGVVASWSGPGGAHLGRVVGGRGVALETGFGSYTSLRVTGDHAVCVAGSPTQAPAVVRIDLGTGGVEVLRRSRDVDVDRQFLSRPERVRFPTGEGEEAWALLYPPASADHQAPPGALPPLVVMSHGGPTSSASAVLNLGVQYWTSRGFMVADVDYRGSTGYGRAYRERLRGNWGVFDVEDCAAVAHWLADQGRTDPVRAVIRGGSAGGFTTLAALAFTDGFAAGASLYGVADLELLARDTHKFESRYLDRLVGPWPAAAERYRQRSPIHHLEGFTCPIILFQGLEDKIVPPGQAELIHRALQERGVPVAYLPFEGEQHGFRRAETVVRVAQAELSFYGRVLGFLPDGAVDVPIDNTEALPIP